MTNKQGWDWEDIRIDLENISYSDDIVHKETILNILINKIKAHEAKALSHQRNEIKEWADNNNHEEVLNDFERKLVINRTDLLTKLKEMGK